MHRSSNNRLPIEDPLIYVPKALTKFHSIWLRLTYPFASIGHNLSIHFSCRLHRSTARRIKIGSSVTMGKDSWINVSSTKEATGEPIIVVDDNVHIGPRAQISARNYIHIEQNTLIASSVLIQDHNHGYEDITKPIGDQPITEGGRIRIREGSWIGNGAVIMCAKGELIVGRHCVVGANSVVLRSCPPYSVVFGNPAKVIRFYNVADKRWTLGSRDSADSKLDDSEQED